MQTQRNDSRENIVVSVGLYRRGSAGGSHDRVLTAFQRFRAACRDWQWRLVCVGEVQSPDDLQYFRDFNFRAAAWQASCVVSPSKEQRSELYARAKICISARNGPPTLDYSVLEIKEAIAHGCIPVVDAQSHEAEICKNLGFDFTFTSAETMEQQLLRAASAAPVNPKIEDFSLQVFCQQWQHRLTHDSRSSVSS
jgi:hypothetical protein